MTTKDVNKIKIEQAEKALAHYAAVVVSKEAAILLNKRLLEDLTKKKKLSEQETKDKEMHSSNINADTEDLSKAQTQVDVFCSLIESYTKNEPVQL